MRGFNITAGLVQVTKDFYRNTSSTSLWTRGGLLQDISRRLSGMSVLRRSV
ncbi:hypothetical protein DPMN_143086 [Dreissena polymorpha]|uniref:Uncharacterized protein n=1 Tax=Dreissena polymorpha TaxID=45954 RepID=A0A9D4JP08_DREPO|nr:hypothetical protein DPMN_143086 [Dreissena polymorpha]